MNKYHLSVFVAVLSIALIVPGCGKKEEAKTPQKPEVTQTKETTPAKADMQKAITKVAGETAEEVPAERASLGEAPDFTLPAIDGSSLSLSDLRGKIVILDFWATWCPPCRKMIPELIDVYNKYKDKGVEIVGISLDEGGTDTVKSFVENVRINYPIVMGNPDISRAYGQIIAIPTSFIIDQNGIIRDKHLGYRSAEDMESVIKDLLAKK